MSTESRVVVITGAGGTLGAALARQLAGEPDTDIVLAYSRRRQLASVAAHRQTVNVPPVLTST